jgi:NAD+ kinase
MGAPDVHRSALVVVHATRAEARGVGSRIASGLMAAGFGVVVSEEDAEGLDLPGVRVVPGDEHAATGCEIVVVVGGDGTILRAAERARGARVPLLGVNLGRVGFLAEAERDDVSRVVDAIVERTWHVEERVVLDVCIRHTDGGVSRTWALNEIAVEKAMPAKMIEVLVAIDGHPLSRWGCDGVVCATPTGSTAYAFSAGGPIVWPEVEAVLVVPLSAHALFARPLVVAPASHISITLSPGSEPAVMSADGRRSLPIEAGATVEVTRHATQVSFARVQDSPFTDRLVAKFDLPVEGWRAPEPDRP